MELASCVIPADCGEREKEDTKIRERETERKRKANGKVERENGREDKTKKRVVINDLMIEREKSESNKRERKRVVRSDMDTTRRKKK